MKNTPTNISNCISYGFKTLDGIVVTPAGYKPIVLNFIKTNVNEIR